MTRSFFTFFVLFAGLASLLLVSACNNLPEGQQEYPSGLDRTTTGDNIYGERESVFGRDGLAIFGGKKNRKDDGSTGIGVNSFLWRAALDTVSFMPLASADPFGGVIITDWFSEPEKPNERYKVNVFILDRQLVSTGVEVRVFREERTNGAWRPSAVADNTATKLEDAILTRARQLRVAANEAN